MTITVHLSTESISEAIAELETVRENIRYGLQQTVEILTKEGAYVAQAAYGGMAAATGYMQGETTGVISASGENAVIAEFGAGDATIDVRFENYPGVDVYPGSYSEQVGSGEYFMTGRWHFGGKTYTEVQPRGGLYSAKVFIQGNAANIAEEVIKL